eukprot:TRINITY_DN18099_c0_g2_i1.p1 TRINITY_DN18099_c0_g2~~TRINITY_DN18099_c0_g2_i1.p1  ORF type:complete len:1452 (+),score=354.94 TRINITY_DN18099_c0_g2_i1:167-4522(+)
MPDFYINAVGPADRPAGRTVVVPQQELGFITNETLHEVLVPEALNSGNVVDIYQMREDDFLEPQAVEVTYKDASGRPVSEVVFTDQLLPGNKPRLVVSVDSVAAMHRAISVLTRKVDNLTVTLKSCREHYYKELIFLRHGRAPEDNEVRWFLPSSYQDNFTRANVERALAAKALQRDPNLEAKNREIKMLRMELDKMRHAQDPLEDNFTRAKSLMTTLPLDQLMWAIRKAVEAPREREVQFWKKCARVLALRCDVLNLDWSSLLSAPDSATDGQAIDDIMADPEDETPKGSSLALQRELDAVSKQLQQSQSESEALRSELTRMDIEMDTMRSTYPDIKVLQALHHATLEENSTLRMSIQHWKEEVNCAQEEIQTHKQALEEEKERVIELEQKLDSLEEELNDAHVAVANADKIPRDDAASGRVQRQRSTDSQPDSNSRGQARGAAAAGGSSRKSRLGTGGRGLSEASEVVDGLDEDAAAAAARRLAATPASDEEAAKGVEEAPEESSLSNPSALRSALTRKSVTQGGSASSSPSRETSQSPRKRRLKDVADRVKAVTIFSSKGLKKGGKSAATMRKTTSDGGSEAGGETGEESSEKPKTRRRTLRASTLGDLSRLQTPEPSERLRPSGSRATTQLLSRGGPRASVKDTRPRRNQKTMLTVELSDYLAKTGSGSDAEDGVASQGSGASLERAGSPFGRQDSARSEHSVDSRKHPPPRRSVVVEVERCEAFAQTRMPACKLETPVQTLLSFDDEGSSWRVLDLEDVRMEPDESRYGEEKRRWTNGKFYKYNDFRELYFDDVFGKSEEADESDFEVIWATSAMASGSKKASPASLRLARGLKAANGLVDRLEKALLQWCTTYSEAYQPATPASPAHVRTALDPASPGKAGLGFRKSTRAVTAALKKLPPGVSEKDKDALQTVFDFLDEKALAPHALKDEASHAAGDGPSSPHQKKLAAMVKSRKAVLKVAKALGPKSADNVLTGKAGLPPIQDSAADSEAPADKADKATAIAKIAFSLPGGDTDAKANSLQSRMKSIVKDKKFNKHSGMATDNTGPAGRRGSRHGSEDLARPSGPVGRRSFRRGSEDLAQPHKPSVFVPRASMDGGIGTTAQQPESPASARPVARRSTITSSPQSVEKASPRLGIGPSEFKDAAEAEEEAELHGAAAATTKRRLSRPTSASSIEPRSEHHSDLGGISHCTSDFGADFEDPFDEEAAFVNQELSSQALMESTSLERDLCREDLSRASEFTLEASTREPSALAFHSTSFETPSPDVPAVTVSTVRRATLNHIEQEAPQGSEEYALSRSVDDDPLSLSSTAAAGRPGPFSRDFVNWDKAQSVIRQPPKSPVPPRPATSMGLTGPKGNWFARQAQGGDSNVSAAALLSEAAAKGSLPTSPPSSSSPPGLQLGPAAAAKSKAPDLALSGSAAVPKLPPTPSPPSSGRKSTRHGTSRRQC